MFCPTQRAAKGAKFIVRQWLTSPLRDIPNLFYKVKVMEINKPIKDAKSSIENGVLQ